VQDGLFSKEEATEEKALKMTIDQYGPVSPAVVPVLNDLAALQRYCAQYSKAEQNNKWGLAIREKNFGSQDLLVAESLDALAGTQVDLGRYAEAEESYQRAAKIQEKDPAALALTLLDLGRLYLLMGKPDEAMSLLKRSLEIHEKAWGPEDPRLVADLEAFAKASAAKSDFDSAEEALKRALTLRQKALSPAHPDIANSLTQLADLYQTSGKAKEAQEYYQKAFKIQNNFLSNADFRSLPVLHAAAMTEFKLGKLKDAEALLNTILKVRKETYGPSHPMVAFGLEDLAAVYEARQLNGKAIVDLKEAKTILEKIFDPGHPEILNVEKRLKNISK
jgi:tetratricopeptide (TPR) repeat protein